MPLYEYRCPNCARSIEVFHGSDPISMLAGAWGIEDYHCGVPYTRVITAPHLHGSPNMPNG